MTPRFTGPPTPASLRQRRGASFASALRIFGEQATASSRRNHYVVNWCWHGQEFITVLDTAGMWWLVPIIGEAS